MDLLELLKLMVRRWYVAVPIAVVTLGAALMVDAAIEPEYKASAAVLLVPPERQPQAAPTSPGAAPQPGNPWLQVGENAMAQAVNISITTKEARDKVSQAGGDPAYEVGLVTRSSIVTIGITTTNPERAKATMTAVLELVRNEVASRQAQYKPKPGEEITTQVLDPGDNVQPSRSNVLRAQIIVAAIGLLLAAAGAVIYDAIQRRRQNALLAVPGSGRARPGTASVVGQAQAVPASAPPMPGPTAANGDNGATTPPAISPVFMNAPRADDTIVISAIRIPQNDIPQNDNPQNDDK